MSVFYVYVLETVSKKGKRSYYTGYTKNLLRRVEEHKNGTGAKFCRGKKIELKYFETYTTRKKAMNREIEIKSFSRKMKKDLIDKFS
ncbi:MAG: GIY-YIG nuclease family protein [Promethearchaeota archaeon]|nr:MAG: GIY-YIG nuclease family protein [Candidatus Lokiarchaeota archaeon]